VRVTEGKTTIISWGATSTSALLAALALITAVSSAQAAQKRAAPKKVAAAKATAPAPAPVGSQTPEPTPIGNPGDWFPPESYPAAAKVAAQQGRTAFSLDIDAAGRIMACNIIESSGSELLDSTTCSQLITNGRFKPALNANGKPVAGIWRSAMRWQLSEADTAKE